LPKKSLQPFLLIFALMFAGCGSNKDIGLARVAVTQLHSQIDNEQFADIYAQADEGFRAATKQQEFYEFISAVHRKLGKVQDASQRSFFVNFTMSGTIVRLNYATKFEQGDAQEEFFWKIKGSQAVLLGYHINSTTLITK
jgi:hypothetical protein